ncbi:MAG: hypothetical protein O3C32_07985 [Bacteroidetes bacterium]|nr:hypothetical protein [Bacteroidota bacterium]
MVWNNERVLAVLADLISENPFACQALLSISTIQFNTETPTLSVSLQAKPVLSINPDFLAAHVETEEELKALFLHEFLHVLLNHTLRYSENSYLLNLALDAIINSIIHRCFGSQYSDFFRRFYGNQGPTVLLRPAERDEIPALFLNTHKNIYLGNVAADDLHELLDFLLGQSIEPHNWILIGNHSSTQPVSEENKAILDGILKRNNGVGIWSKGKEPGEGNKLEHRYIQGRGPGIARWRAQVYMQLRAYLSPPMNSLEHQSIRLKTPIANALDRSAYFKWIQGRMLPMFEQQNKLDLKVPRALVYLDVSASMKPDLVLIIELLYALKSRIPMEIFTFSNAVNLPIWKGKGLKVSTTQGTDLDCVIDHMNKHKSHRALIVTDGYLPSITNGLQLKYISLFFILSSTGSTHFVNKYEFPYHQLNALPE